MAEIFCSKMTDKEVLCVWQSGGMMLGCVCVCDSLLEACQSYWMLNGGFECRMQCVHEQTSNGKALPELHGHAKWDPHLASGHLKVSSTRTVKNRRLKLEVKSGGAKRRGHESALTVLTVTLKGVAAVEDGSMVAEDLSEEPGMLRRRPVLSGGDSAHRKRDLGWRTTEIGAILCFLLLD